MNRNCFHFLHGLWAGIRTVFQWVWHYFFGLPLVCAGVLSMALACLLGYAHLNWLMLSSWVAITVGCVMYVRRGL